MVAFLSSLFIGFILSSFGIIVVQCGDHHEIPIISNNSIINNTFSVVSSINFTSLLQIDDQEASESYDDSFALMEDYENQEEETEEDDGHKVTPTSSEELQEKEGDEIDDDDENTDFGFLATRARWSYAPGFIERICRSECQAHAKPFGRLIGTKCQCYCPLNAPTLNLCEHTGKCDRYCAEHGYSRGGDCVYNNVCFCNCKKSAPYDVTRVYS